MPKPIFEDTEADMRGSSDYPTSGGGTTVTTAGTDTGLGSPTYTVGSNEVIAEIPGDLGTRSRTQSTDLLLKEAYRSNASLNLFRPWNHRYRGHRESNKFNLNIQNLLLVSAQTYRTLRSADEALQALEMTTLYPPDADITNIYHIHAQLVFKEWMLLKDDNINWFV